MFKRIKMIIACSLCLAPCFALGEGVTNGQYEVCFRISDMVVQQELTISNCWWTNRLTTMYYDVVIKKAGSFKMFHRGIQTVRGVLHKGKFKFIIPNVDVDTESVFIFEGSNVEEDGGLKGTGTLLCQGLNIGNSTFSFRMKRMLPSNEKCSLPTQNGDKSPGGL